MTLGELRAYLTDPQVGKARKLLLVAAFAYVVLPFDAIPDVIPIFGWLDDIGVLGAAAAFLLSDARRVALAKRALPG